MTFTIITPPGIEQPYHKFTRIIPATGPEYNQALDEAKNTTIIITTKTLTSNWHKLLNNCKYAQDEPTTLPIILHGLQVRFDPRLPSVLDLALQLLAAGYRPEPTGLAHYDYAPTLRELRYLHSKWHREFPVNLHQEWGWGSEGIYWNDAIIHHASTTIDHQVGIC